MALWGISTTTETLANNYGIPKHLSEVDKNRTPHNCFADNRGWIYRHYTDGKIGGISTQYTDEIIVPVIGLNTTGIASNTTGLGLATPTAVFFVDPNNAPIISTVGGASTGISTNTVGYVHLVFNEMVYAGAGATINLLRSTGAALVATAASTGSPVQVNIPGIGQTVIRFNGQLTNRVAFAFTAPSTGIGTYISIDMASGFVGVITDAYNGAGVTSSFASTLIRNISGAGSTSGVGIGVTTLIIKA
jgi:hypothetical protein